jgi:hypothetical protein
LELLHDRQKIILDRAANAPVGKVVNLGAMLQSGGAQQSTVDRNFAELIDKDSQASIWRLFEQPANKGGFSGTEKSGDNGDWDFHKEVAKRYTRFGTITTERESIAQRGIGNPWPEGAKIT